MWDEIFSDPWSSRFQTSYSPFTGFGGFYAERAHPFWGNPVYFPCDKRRKVSHRKKARSVDDRTENPVCYHTRGKPLKIELDKKPKEKTNNIETLEPNLPQDAIDIPVEFLPPEEDKAPSRNREQSSRDTFIDNDAVEKPEAVQENTIRSADRSADEAENLDLSHGTDNEVESAKESRPVESGKLSAVEEEKLNEIKIQLTKARELRPRVKAFEGSRRDKEFLYLDEHLTQCILSLDLIDTDGLENVKVARREAVSEILSVINNLESSVQE